VLLSLLLRMKVKVDWALTGRGGILVGGAGEPRAKAQVLGLVPAALLGRLTAH
jgi:hypothetical protein